MGVPKTILVHRVTMATAAAAVKKGGAYWRLAGLTYLDQLNVATSALRKVLKEPHRTEVLGKSQYRFRDFAFADGKELPPGQSRALSCRWNRLPCRECHARGGAALSLFRFLRAPARASPTQRSAARALGACVRRALSPPRYYSPCF